MLLSFYEELNICLYFTDVSLRNIYFINSMTIIKFNADKLCYCYGLSQNFFVIFEISAQKYNYFYSTFLLNIWVFSRILFDYMPYILFLGLSLVVAFIYHFWRICSLCFRIFSLLFLHKGKIVHFSQIELKKLLKKLRRVCNHYLVKLFFFYLT